MALGLVVVLVLLQVLEELVRVFHPLEVC
jgi:hypothetical protein